MHSCKWVCCKFGATPRASQTEVRTRTYSIHGARLSLRTRLSILQIVGVFAWVYIPSECKKTRLTCLRRRSSGRTRDCRARDPGLDSQVELSIIGLFPQRIFQ